MIAMMRQAMRNYVKMASELNRTGFHTAKGGLFQFTQFWRLARKLASKGTGR